MTRGDPTCNETLSSACDFVQQLRRYILQCKVDAIRNNKNFKNRRPRQQ
jgi:hypothetical protein